MKQKCRCGSREITAQIYTEFRCRKCGDSWHKPHKPRKPRPAAKEVE